MAYPRQGYSVPIAALDEYDHPTAGVFRVHETGVGTKMHVSCMLLYIPYLGILHTCNTIQYMSYSYSMLTALPYLACYTLLHCLI